MFSPGAPFTFPIKPLLLRLCQLLNSLTDAVIITDKAFMKLFLTKLKIKPYNQFAANATGTGCRNRNN